MHPNPQTSGGQALELAVGEPRSFGGIGAPASQRDGTGQAMLQLHCKKHYVSPPEKAT